MPEFVFLAHGVDVMSAMHAPFVFRSFASMPYTTRLFLLPMWPFTFMVMLGMWVWSKTFLFSFYTLRNNLCQTWGVPRFGFQVNASAFFSVLPSKNRQNIVFLQSIFLCFCSTFYRLLNKALTTRSRMRFLGLIRLVLKL